MNEPGPSRGKVSPGLSDRNALVNALMGARSKIDALLADTNPQPGEDEPAQPGGIAR
jgi:hypothetical protein